MPLLGCPRPTADGQLSFLGQVSSISWHEPVKDQLAHDMLSAGLCSVG
jgi:hypothetical protein